MALQQYHDCTMLRLAEVALCRGVDVQRDWKVDDDVGGWVDARLLFVFVLPASPLYMGENRDGNSPFGRLVAELDSLVEAKIIQEEELMAPAKAGE
jgi:hypothetical protein